jgi:short-subunit dehydrogenase
VAIGTSILAAQFHPKIIMTFKEKYGDTALVAGGSEGIGAAYARALAARGLNLVLVARKKEQLETIGREITKQFRVNVLPINCDLGEVDAVQKIIQMTGDMTIDFMVYNAASSYIGPYLSTSLSTHTGITAVNMLSPLSMLYYFGRKMTTRRRGGIVIMTSLAGFQGSAYLSTYAATKAFIRILAEGLWYEWKPYGVDVIACCAGATTTPNYLKTNPRKASWLEPKPQLPEQVVEECMRRIGTTPSFVSGGGNKVATFLMQHVFSKKKAVETMGDAMKKMYRIE